MSALYMPARGHVQIGAHEHSGLCALLDQLQLALALLDEELHVQWWNRAAEDLSGRSRDEVLGSYWGQDLLLTLEDVGIGCEPSRNFLRHRDGHLLRVRAQMMPCEFGERSGAMVSISSDSRPMCILDHARRDPKLDLIDPLTGLGNRRLAAIEFEAFLIRYQLHRREFGVALFDVDLLHQVVKRFGYDCSDRALQVVARTLAGCLDEHDLLCRWGGDQFLALVVGDHEEAQAKAELCRRAVEWASLDWGGEPVPLTISAGVEMGSPGDHSEDLVGRAAFRLRMSKRLGRNRVTSGAASQAE